MSKYRKKPVVIEAVKVARIDPFDCTMIFTESQTGWLWKAKNEDTIYWDPESRDWFIKTLEGDHKISEGDYIVQGIKGELYPCKPDIFEQTYDIVEDLRMKTNTM